MTVVDEMAERRKNALKKYADIKARADHPNTPVAEKEVAYRMAAKVMADWEIAEIEVSAATGAEQAVVAIMVRVGDTKDPIDDERRHLMINIGTAFECRSMIMERPYGIEEGGTQRKGGVYVQVIGFRHDVEMARDLYYLCSTDLVAGMLSERNIKDRRSFARDYVYVMRMRVRNEIRSQVNEAAVNGSVSSSVALVLAGKADKVAVVFNEMHPPGSYGSWSAKSFTPNPAAAARGRDRANKMDLGQRGRMSGNGAKGVGEAKKGLNRG